MSRKFFRISRQHGKGAVVAWSKVVQELEADGELKKIYLASG
jgi:hypothetical protein